MLDRLSLNSLKFFYYVAREESVTVAAEKLFVTQSAVSKQISHLEKSLNIALFIREHRKLYLTAEGEKLFACCQSIFQQIEQCVGHLTSKSSVQSSLVVSCEPTLAMKWLIPRLAQFNELHPSIEITLLTSGGQVDFRKQHIDIALRRNDFKWSNSVFSEKIADEYMAVVQTKKQDRGNAQIFVSSSRPQLWKNYVIQNPRGFDFDQKVILDHFYLCLEACLASLGATIISAYMIEKELNYPLLELKQPIYHDGSTYYLLSEHAFELDIRKQIFKDWLIGEMEESQKQF